MLIQKILHLKLFTHCSWRWRQIILYYNLDNWYGNCFFKTITCAISVYKSRSHHLANEPSPDPNSLLLLCFTERAIVERLLFCVVSECFIICGWPITSHLFFTCICLSGAHFETFQRIVELSFWRTVSWSHFERIFLASSCQCGLEGNRRIVGGEESMVIRFPFSFLFYSFISFSLLVSFFFFFFFPFLVVSFFLLLAERSCWQFWDQMISQ